MSDSVMIGKASRYSFLTSFVCLSNYSYLMQLFKKKLFYDLDVVNFFGINYYSEDEP